MLRLCLEHPGSLGQEVLQLERVAVRRGARQRFDAAHASGGAGLVREAKQRDLSCRADVCAAAELERHTGNVHDANHIAVFLAE